MGVIFSLLGWVVHLYVMVIMIRFLGHLLGLPYSNQFMQLTYNLTRQWSAPLRPIFPVIAGVDIGLLVAAYVLLVLKASFPMIVGVAFAPVMLLMAFVELFTLVVDIFFFSIIVSIIVSFLAPGLYHPFIQAAYGLSEPLLRPVRSMIPPISGFDLSPIFVIMALKASEMIVFNLLR